MCVWVRNIPEREWKSSTWRRRSAPGPRARTRAPRRMAVVNGGEKVSFNLVLVENPLSVNRAIYDRAIFTCGASLAERARALYPRPQRGRGMCVFSKPYPNAPTAAWGGGRRGGDRLRNKKKRLYVTANLKNDKEAKTFTAEQSAANDVTSIHLTPTAPRTREERAFDVATFFSNLKLIIATQRGSRKKIALQDPVRECRRGSDPEPPIGAQLEFLTTAKD
ncbi:hypothetical protein EVAR_43368_1 [Eumeta japonica]|uniref:Uncharacterized protein n=1 Tax=Eumeta variegata TaxID=151549 RepID=A0A4C1WRA0_EUMVA|nr:hypothetical protein EVAR_43368_1 [Eumeta japonica]